jgi:hypothetical protein
MKAEYISLTNGRKIRIEWNWNTVAEWTARTGREITDLNDGKADVSQMRTIAYCCAVEGESIDGKELGMSEVEFGRLVNMQGIVDFAKILTSQALLAEQKKSEAPTKLQKIFLRKKG